MLDSLKPQQFPKDFGARPPGVKMNNPATQERPLILRGLL
jgi:hypothetical protein